MGVVGSQKYMDARLGIVHIRALSTATRFTARWKADGLHVTIPGNTPIEKYKRVMDGWTDHLLKSKPGEKPSKYSLGYRFETDDWEFEIVRDSSLRSQNIRSEFVGYSDDSKTVRRFRISVAADVEPGRQSAEQAIDRLVLGIAGYMAEKVLLRQAREEAARLCLDKRVKSYEVGRGLRRMGFCSAEGRISLSHALMFMPRDLRRCTITHELAHLTHFDHSPAFYALWDCYLGYSHTIAREKAAACLKASGFGS